MTASAVGLTLAQVQQVSDSPYLGRAAYQAFWSVAVSTGQAVPGWPPFETLQIEAQWAWHAAGWAAAESVS